MKPNHRAFTLVELLVVITIIVVLLAMLTPAIDRAVYQAELTLCASHLRVISTASIFYASSSKRFYPDRPQFHTPHQGWQAALLYNGDDVVNAAIMSDGTWDSQKFDDRLWLRPLTGLGVVPLDPLVRKIDLEDFNIRAFGYDSYALWVGWAFRRGGVNLPGMRKLGDRLQWADGGKATPTDSFDLLAADEDDVNSVLNPDAVHQSQSSHPDKDGAAANSWFQNGFFFAGAYPLTATFSFWRCTDRVRGPDDLNFAHDDASVERYTDVKYGDDRMRYAQDRSNDDNPVGFTWALTMPPR